LISLDSDEPGVFPQDFGFEPKLSLKEYYDLLNSNEKYQKMVSAAINGTLSDLGDGVESQTVDSHKKWEVLKDDPIAEEMVKDIIRQASETCQQSNNWGDISSDLVQAIQNCFEPKENIIPWQIILKNFLASSSENVLSYSMKRLSKRYGTRPGTKKEDVLSVAIGIDTSGSISDEMLTIFFAELESIAKTNTKMTIFEWDTKVQRKYDFRDFDGQVKGRGGTDANTALSEIAEENYGCDGTISSTLVEVPYVYKVK
jgi:predicted metal-dependent peptidase